MNDDESFFFWGGRGLHREEFKGSCVRYVCDISPILYDSTHIALISPIGQGWEAERGQKKRPLGGEAGMVWTVGSAERRSVAAAEIDHHIVHQCGQR